MKETNELVDVFVPKRTCPYDYILTGKIEKTPPGAPFKQETRIRLPTGDLIRADPSNIRDAWEGPSIDPVDGGEPVKKNDTVELLLPPERLLSIQRPARRVRGCVYDDSCAPLFYTVCISMKNSLDNSSYNKYVTVHASNLRQPGPPFPSEDPHIASVGGGGMGANGIRPQGVSRIQRGSPLILEHSNMSAWNATMGGRTGLEGGGTQPPPPPPKSDPLNTLQGAGEKGGLAAGDVASGRGGPGRHGGARGGTPPATQPPALLQPGGPKGAVPGAKEKEKDNDAEGKMNERKGAGGGATLLPQQQMASRGNSSAADRPSPPPLPSLSPTQFNPNAQPFKARSGTASLSSLAPTMTGGSMGGGGGDGGVSLSNLHASGGLGGGGIPSLRTPGQQQPFPFSLSTSLSSPSAAGGGGDVPMPPPSSPGGGTPTILSSQAGQGRTPPQQNHTAAGHGGMRGEEDGMSFGRMGRNAQQQHMGGQQQQMPFVNQQQGNPMQLSGMPTPPQLSVSESGGLDASAAAFPSPTQQGPGFMPGGLHGGGDMSGSVPQGDLGSPGVALYSNITNSKDWPLVCAGLFASQGQQQGFGAGGGGGHSGLQMPYMGGDQPLSSPDHASHAFSQSVHSPFAAAFQQHSRQSPQSGPQLTITAHHREEYETGSGGAPSGSPHSSVAAANLIQSFTMQQSPAGQMQQQQGAGMHMPTQVHPLSSFTGQQTQQQQPAPPQPPQRQRKKINNTALTNNTDSLTANGSGSFLSTSSGGGGGGGGPSVLPSQSPSAGRNPNQNQGGGQGGIPSASSPSMQPPLSASSHQQQQSPAGGPQPAVIGEGDYVFGTPPGQQQQQMGGGGSGRPPSGRGTVSSQRSQKSRSGGERDGVSVSDAGPHGNIPPTMQQQHPPNSGAPSIHSPSPGPLSSRPSSRGGNRGGGPQ
uniref:Uncharacterized protein n=1 Tax=Chromera velia CCMP2878 TaxID=1169474 RepID=A0A0G4HSK1_9ALVE|eukprot:Cvel_8278.t1-p1 / transcript=Cvel_8278.t1 / gene=Cvel_8278 / organism=Chromera_velia_CCMP2878 / gene_product=hypothetical protein / transcript_product=hypothetical protein / location=Cvel_scaffold454:30703-35759(+) / protein_length=922 / sequence_SO=supercontig / SO=protein_coding / is_pseudo=false